MNIRSNIKFLAYIVIFLLYITCFSLRAENPVEELPTTEILGTEYYVYEAKKGESIYGIAKKFNWDAEKLIKLNNKVIGGVKKGTRLYYPKSNESPVRNNEEGSHQNINLLEPIRHTVKKGETIYGISRQYALPLDYIYEVYPSAKRGVKVGETIVIPQNPNNKYVFHTVKKNETLSDVAKLYNTSIEDILKDNSGLSQASFKEGEKIRIANNSNSGNSVTQIVPETQVTAISTYKVNKNEDWVQIAEKTGTDVDLLKEVNNSMGQPQENEIVTIPVVESIEMENTIFVKDIRELSEEGIDNIYDSIHGNLPDDGLTKKINVALVLDDPNSNRDLDFTRGILLGLNGFATTDYKIDLNVMDGRVSSNNLLDELDEFEPSFIIVTADKAFPLFLADYGNSNNLQVINVFDVKNDLYEDNSSIIQMLPPSYLFNTKAAQGLHEANKDRKLIMVGDIDENDGIAEDLVELYDEDTENLNLEELGAFMPDLFSKFLFYSYATKKSDVGDFFRGIDNIKETYPGLDFVVVGRPNWVTMLDDYGNKFNEYEVMVPAKVWLDENSKEWKALKDTYTEMFGGDPLRSMPNYVATGYDLMNYFIPVISSNGGDFNKTTQFNRLHTLQTEMDLKRVNNWGGFVNTSGYMLKFKQSGDIDKQLLK
ncbi:MAG: LysM peptidoglycan-binding domain-containing protein [Muribaculaceae bacterium]|nr:LysM peptidoglycan-binding domain-containing protein [Muribaculaceae bacterium]